MKTDMKTGTYAPIAPPVRDQVPRAADLGAWTHHLWDHGFQIEQLWAGDQLVLRTANTTYELTVVSPSAREVIIRGGHFFPERTGVRLDGCSLGGAFLKLGGLYVGFSLELRGDTGVVVTSPVRSIGFVQHG